MLPDQLYLLQSWERPLPRRPDLCGENILFNRKFN